LKFGPHDFVETIGQVLAHSAPFSYHVEMKRLLRENTGIIVGDRVTPVVQFLELEAPVTGARVDLIDLAPKVKSETSEIRADVPGIRVSCIQFPIQEKYLSKRVSQSNLCN